MKSYKPTDKRYSLIVLSSVVIEYYLYGIIIFLMTPNAWNGIAQFNATNVVFIGLVSYLLKIVGYIITLIIIRYISFEFAVSMVLLFSGFSSLFILAVPYTIINSPNVFFVFLLIARLFNAFLVGISKVMVVDLINKEKQNIYYRYSTIGLSCFLGLFLADYSTSIDINWKIPLTVVVVSSVLLFLFKLRYTEKTFHKIGTNFNALACMSLSLRKAWVSLLYYLFFILTPGYEIGPSRFTLLGVYCLFVLSTVVFFRFNKTFSDYRVVNDITLMFCMYISSLFCMTSTMISGFQYNLWICVFLIFYAFWDVTFITNILSSLKRTERTVTLLVSNIISAICIGSVLSFIAKKPIGELSNIMLLLSSVLFVIFLIEGLYKLKKVPKCKYDIGYRLRQYFLPRSLADRLSDWYSSEYIIFVFL